MPDPMFNPNDPWGSFDDRLSKPPDLGLMHSNPLAAGVQFGMVGAGAGLGYAAVQRAIRLRMGNKSSMSILKPLMIGTLIGSTIGYGGTAMNNRYRSPKPRPETWREVSNTVYDNMYGNSSSEKYAAAPEFDIYRQAEMYKYAGFWDKTKSIAKGVGRAGLFVGDMALWLNPATLPYRLAAELAYRGGKGAYYLARGEKKKALGQGLMGLGSAAFGGLGRLAGIAGKAGRPLLRGALGASALGADVGLGTAGDMMGAGGGGIPPKARPQITNPGSNSRFAGLGRMTGTTPPTMPRINMPSAPAFRKYV